MSRGAIGESCLDDAFFAALVAGDAAPAERLAALAHVDRCAHCRGLMAAVLKPAAASDSERSGELDPTLRGHDTAEPRVAVGDSIDHYTVLGILGRGAYGIVMHARDTKLGREVALKLLRAVPGLDDRRLVREARAMARLSHPNVVMVHETGVTERGVYVAMEMVDGTTLREWLSAAPR
ncbi:MAG: protein kinase, partial [Myxococcota bacterium]